MGPWRPKLPKSAENGQPTLKFFSNKTTTAADAATAPAPPASNAGQSNAGPDQGTAVAAVHDPNASATALSTTDVDTDIVSGHVASLASRLAGAGALNKLDQNAPSPSTPPPQQIGTASPASPLPKAVSSFSAPPATAAATATLSKKRKERDSIKVSSSAVGQVGENTTKSNAHPTINTPAVNPPAVNPSAGALTLAALFDQIGVAFHAVGQSTNRSLPMFYAMQMFGISERLKRSKGPLLRENLAVALGLADSMEDSLQLAASTGRLSWEIAGVVKKFETSVVVVEGADTVGGNESAAAAMEVDSARDQDVEEEEEEIPKKKRSKKKTNKSSEMIEMIEEEEEYWMEY